MSEHHCYIEPQRCAGHRTERTEQDVNAELRRQRAEITRLQSEVERLREQTRWIPVEERLPEDGKMVLLAVKDDCPDTGWNEVGVWWQGKWFDSKGPVCSDITVSHWMPLPLSPSTVKEPQK